MRRKLSLACLLLLLTSASYALESGQAELLFKEYQALGRAFDPAVADLYCDTALIRNTRTYPTGEKRAIEFPAPKYKELIRSVMPLAKARNDYSTYSEVQFMHEGENTRITAARYSALKDYVSPVSILVGRCGNGRVGVLEEITESIP